MVRPNRGLGLCYLSDGGRTGGGASSVLLDRTLARAAGPLFGFSPVAQPEKIDFFSIVVAGPAGAPVRQVVNIGGGDLRGKPP